ncbi:APC family permease [Streptomyces kasugaensis]|uniref:APC family permease n=1 Tax=Streptomyces kasugaensis TaxID=1946 RepID=A0A4V2JII5_STRKA|nr:APC family permease [Streptomyces kasugaensis]TBO58711.1 APC family permease [Streptomyces kasugaensis]
MSSADPPQPPFALRRFDATAMLLCAIVGLDTLGSVAARGPQGLIWMAVLGLLYFAPYGLLIAELGSAFPQEGGPYVWTKLAFGRFTAGINQVFYWISNPVWLGGSLCVTAIATFESFFFPLPGGWKYLAGAVFIGAAGLAVHASVRSGRWVPIAGAVARIALLGFFVVSLVLYALRHGVHPPAAGDYTPTYLGLVALAPVIAFNYMGFEVPSAAAGEMADPKRDVPAALLRGGLLSALLYGVPIFGTLLVLPSEQVGSLTGFIDACRAVFTVYGGHIGADGTVVLTGAGSVLAMVAAAGLIIGLLTSGTAWAMGVSRAQAVACADGAGPRWLGVISARRGTPTRVNLISTGIAALVMVASLALSGGDAQKYFTAGIGLAISATAISYLLTFSSFIVLRRKYPHVSRPYRIPGGQVGAWTVTVLTVGTMLFAVVALIWPGLGVGWFGTSGDPAGYLPTGFEGQRAAYTATQLVPVVLIISLGCLLYALGARHRRTIASAAFTTQPDRGAFVETH